MELNAEQIAAVQHPVGAPAILLASAGAGKTASLTARIVWLIDQAHVVPKRILALTFTNKAANEMRSRVFKALPHLEESDGPRLTTIHSLALSMIRRNPPAFGLPPKISPIDDYDQSQVMKRIVAREKWEDVNTYKILEQIEFHRARGVGFSRDYTDEVHERAKKEFDGYHALRGVDLEAWKLFETEKNLMGVVDFSDMIHLCIQRFDRDEAWRIALGKVYAHVLMDECQDTSPTSWKFVTMLLAPDNPNFLPIGDTSQAIFSFIGAKPSIIHDYIDGWRGYKPVVYKLTKNHRSIPEIVRLANRVQHLMPNEIPMKMISYRGDLGETGTTNILTGETPEDISFEIVREIKEKGIPYKDCCLLMRSGIQLRDIEGAFIRARIPYVVRGGKSLLQTEEVRDILSYVRLATNHKDFSALVRASSMAKGVGDAKLEVIRKLALEKHEGDLIAASKAMGPMLGNLVNTVTMVGYEMADPIGAIQAAITHSGYVTHVQRKYAKDKDRIETKLDNLLRLKDMIRGLMDETDLTVDDLIFQMTMDKPEKESPEGCVTISTIHSAKGLEWPRVWVLSVVEKALPHWRSANDEEIAEERRVWYVAATRARDHLTICVPSQIMQGKYMSPCRPSRFLVELGLFSQDAG